MVSEEGLNAYGAVTWGQFFQNIGYDVNDGYVMTPQHMHVTSDQNKVVFILNGEKTTNIANQVINDKDRLLIDYGNTSKSDLQKEYDSVANTAGKYDQTKDPASCSGSHSGTMQDRMRHMF